MTLNNTALASFTNNCCRILNKKVVNSEENWLTWGLEPRLLRIKWILEHFLKMVKEFDYNEEFKLILTVVEGVEAETFTRNIHRFWDMCKLLQFPFESWSKLKIISIT